MDNLWDNISRMLDKYMQTKKIENLAFFILICLIFILLTMVWTYPLVFRTETSVFADKDWLFDTLAAIYGTWMNKMAWLGTISFDFNNLIGYPFGLDTSNINREPVLEVPLLFLALWKNEIFAFNIIVLSSFFLSAVTMYFLAWNFTKDRTASFLSAIVYAFCPYHSLQCFSHMSLAVMQWLPLYVLCLFRFGEKATYLRSIICVVIFLILALSNYYYAYVMFIFSLVFFICIFYRKYRNKDNAFNFLKKNLLMGLIIVAVLVPLNYRAVVSVWKGTDSKAEMPVNPAPARMLENSGLSLRATEGSEAIPSEIASSVAPLLPRNDVFGQPVARRAGINRQAPPLGDLFRYSASITDYIRPSEYHPVFGKVDFWFIKPYTNPSRHWAEKTVFLGYVPLILSFCFFPKIFKSNTHILFISSIVAFIISLPPMIAFFPMPGYFFYKIFPMFRSYARFGILVILSISVFAGLGFKEILVRVQRKGLFSFMIIGLVLFEFTVIPPFRNVDFSKIPPVYKWIQDLPDKGAIAEYPLFSEIDSKHYKYLFYQRVHEHPLFNGSPVGSIGDAIRHEVMDISKIRSAGLLSYLGIQYVVLHKDSYNNEEMGLIDKNTGLEKLKDFEDTRVYKVIAIPAKTEFFFWRNFGDSEKWDDGNFWRWADNNSTICFINSEKEPVKISVLFKVISFARERELQMYLNGGLVSNTTISSPVALSNAQEVRSGLLLRPGYNILGFYSPVDGFIIDSILHNGDKRRVCFGFSDIEIMR